MGEIEKGIIAKVIIKLSAAYPSFKAEHPRELLELWGSKLADFKEPVLDLAVDLAITKYKFFPSLNEFLQACRVSQVDYDSAMGDLSRRIATTNALREQQNQLEQGAVNGEFDPGAWEDLARSWQNAGREFAAQACREKADLILKNISITTTI